MTKLYHGPEGFGWQIPGKQEKKAIKIEVPNAPAELADWLNDRWVQPDRSEPSLAEILALEDIRNRDAGELTPNIPTPLSPAPTSAIAAHLVAGDLLAIESWILDDATPNQVEHIFGAIGVRFHELRKAAGR